MVGQLTSMQKYYDDISKNGVKSYPRGLETVGLVDQSFWFYPGEVYSRPQTNISIGFIELLQFISGTFSITPFKIAAPKARLDLFTGQSAYGPRVADQLPKVIEELRSDSSTRRAVLMIAHPTDTKETIPCTLSMQFQIQTDKASTPVLHTIVTMRSSDLVWGLPTDIIQFGGMSMMIASCVSAIAGECVVNAGNAHIYTETKLKEGEQYTLSGYFNIPNFYTLEEYQDWAKRSLDLIEQNVSPKNILNYQKNIIGMEV